MAKKGKKEETREVSRKKGAFSKIKSTFDNFLNFILMINVKIVDTTFSCQDKVSYMKNLVHI